MKKAKWAISINKSTTFKILINHKANQLIKVKVLKSIKIYLIIIPKTLETLIYQIEIIINHLFIFKIQINLKISRLIK